MVQTLSGLVDGHPERQRDQLQLLIQDRVLILGQGGEQMVLSRAWGR